jgi:hypothetical protein
MTSSYLNYTAVILHKIAICFLVAVKHNNFVTKETNAIVSYYRTVYFISATCFDPCIASPSGGFTHMSLFILLPNLDPQLHLYVNIHLISKTHHEVS